MAKNSFDTLANDIFHAYKDGIDELTAACRESADIRSKECLESIKTDSPSDSGDYKKGWKRRKTKDGYMVYNNTRPDIEMPLEHGHLSKGKRVGARPHIYKNADDARDKYVNDCIGTLKKIR